jgi:hypothetical protein
MSAAACTLLVTAAALRTVAMPHRRRLHPALPPPHDAGCKAILDRVWRQQQAAAAARAISVCARAEGCAAAAGAAVAPS